MKVRYNLLEVLLALPCCFADSPSFESQADVQTGYRLQVSDN